MLTHNQDITPNIETSVSFCLLYCCYVGPALGVKAIHGENIANHAVVLIETMVADVNALTEDISSFKEGSYVNYIDKMQPKAKYKVNFCINSVPT